MTKKIYIVHGWTYTTDYWEDCLSELKARKIKPVMLNVPGLTKPSDRVWDIESYATWLEEELANEDEVTLLGHSNGGRIALNLCVRNHSKIKQLILVDSAGVYHDEALLRLKRWTLGNAAAIGKKVLPVKPAREALYKVIGAKDYYQAPPNMRETMKNMLESDKFLDASKVKAPTVLIWGDKDQATPLSDAQKLNQQIKGSTLKIIHGAKHAPYHTHTKEFVDTLEQVLID